MRPVQAPPRRAAPRSNDPCWCGSGRKYKRCHRLSELPLSPGRVSPRRAVPEGIGRPDYADTGHPGREADPGVQPPEVIDAMRRIGRIAGEVLDTAAAAIAPGVTTDEIDALVHEECLRRGVYPSTLNYRGFPKSLCTSVNEVICHGIPDDRPLRNGDIVNLDITVFGEGVHGDTSATFPVGVVDEASARLMQAALESLWAGIAAIRPGRPISDIGRAIEAVAADYGYGVVRAFGGHGIGRSFHTGLHIPHHYEPRASRVMRPGMVFTVEPMLSAGSVEPEIWDDGWTAVTRDRSRSAQYEHTVVVTEEGAEVLTPSRSLPAAPRPQRPSSS